MAIIEADGEVALAMRPLAARLEVTPMALYRYFEDRDALLLALVDRVSRDLELPEPAVDPVEASVELALCLHDFLVLHPWLIRLISTGRLASPAGLHFPEGFIGAALRSGRDSEQAFLFYRAMFATILGQATITLARRGQAPMQVAERAASEPLPLVSELAPRWQQLNDGVTPRRAFHLVAATLHAQ